MSDTSIMLLRRHLNLDQRRGILGDAQGVVRDTANGHYYVRIEKSPGSYYPPVSLPLANTATVAPKAGVPVYVGYDPIGKRDVIVGMVTSALGQIGISPFVSNSSDPAAADLIPQERLATLYSRPHSDTLNKAFYAQVYPARLVSASAVVSWAGGEIDLESFLPTSGNHRYVMVFVKSDFATLEAFGSTEQATTSALDDTDLTEAFVQRSSDSIVVRAYKLTSSDISLNGSFTDSPFVRQIVSDTATHAHYFLRQPVASWVINEIGGDYDGRIEGDTDENLTVWDAGADKVCIGTSTPDSGAKLTIAGFTRASTATYRRYYHVSLGSANPGGSGPTWVEAGANTTGGWRLTNAAWYLRGQTDVHADWDGSSDLEFDVNFMVNINNTGGDVGDTVDLKATIYYKGVGDTATKSQVVEVPTVVGQSAQYKQFKALFAINWDYADNVVEVGDVIAIVLNLETDTSEVDDIVVTSMEFYYNTTHIGVESGDV